MKNIRHLSLLIVVTFLVSACSANGGEVSEGSTEDNKVLEAVPVVTKALATESVDEEVYAFGYLEPSDSYFAAPYGAGVVDDILVEVGDRVEKDSILYQLEADDLTSTKEKDLLQQESNIRSAKNNLDAQALNLEQRKGDLDVRAMSLETLKKNYESTVELFNEGIVSQLDLDNALSNYDQAQISYNQAQLTYESTQLSYNLAKNSYSDAQVNYNLSLEDYDGKNSDLFVVAPISGLVTDVTVQKGIMNQGTTGVTVIDDTKMILKINVMEKYIHQIKVGQSVRLTFDYMEGEQIATVSKISLTAKNGYYPVEIEIPNENGKFTTGMYSEGYIQVDSIDNVFMIDKTALMVDDSDGTEYIFIVRDEKNLAEKVSITRGLEDGDRVQIKGALKVGDKVVVVGQDYVADGQLVSEENLAEK